MSTFTWPEAIVPSAFSFALEPNVREFESPFTRSYQSVDLLGERWRATLVIPPRYRRDSGAVEALFNKLRGIHKLSLWHFGRPEPVGSLRGSPVTAGIVAQGASSLSLSGCTNGNLVSNAQSFDSAMWVKTSAGSGIVPVVTPNVFAAPDGTFTADQVVFDKGTLAGNSTLLGPNVVMAPGLPYSFSVWVYGNVGGQTLQVSIAGASAATFAIVAGVWQSCAVTYTDATGGTYNARIGTTSTSPATTRNADVLLWGARFEQAATPTPYVTPSLRAGDLVGAGGMLFQASDDCAANDAGALTVPLVNRPRSAIASGSAVTWFRPTSAFRLADPRVPVLHSPVIAESVQLDLIESW